METFDEWDVEDWLSAIFIPRICHSNKDRSEAEPLLHILIAFGNVGFASVVSARIMGNTQPPRNRTGRRVTAQVRVLVSISFHLHSMILWHICRLRDKQCRFFYWPQKFENAKKTGVLSLSEHKLEACPPQLFEWVVDVLTSYRIENHACIKSLLTITILYQQQRLANIRTLDLSKNALVQLNPEISKLTKIKLLNLESNQLTPGTLAPISKLANLQNLSVGNNVLGKPTNSAKKTIIEYSDLI